MDDILDSSLERGLKFRYYLNPLGNITSIMIVLIVLILILRSIAIYKLGVLHPINGGSMSNVMDLMWWANLIDVCQYVYLGLFVLSIIPFSMWLYRAYFNLDCIKLKGLNVVPGWAVGWCFIPIAQLYYIPVIMHDVLKGTKHVLKGNERTNSIEYESIFPIGVPWVILRILATVFSYLGLVRFIKNPDPSIFNSCLRSEIFTCVFIILSGIIALYFVYYITAKQNQILKQQ